MGKDLMNARLFLQLRYAFRVVRHRPALFLTNRFSRFWIWMGA
jgi:hypothetical protein